MAILLALGLAYAITVLILDVRGFAGACQPASRCPLRVQAVRAAMRAVRAIRAPPPRA